MSDGGTGTVTPNVTTTYNLVSVVSSSTTCIGTVSGTIVTVTVNTAPSAMLPVYNCNATNDGYTATFDITGGSGGTLYNY